MDHRSRPLVHLGTKPGSKVYRLFDPTQQRIVVSRGVLFEENKAGDWNKITPGVTERPGSFEVPLGDHEKQGNGEDDAADSNVPKDEDVAEEENDETVVETDEDADKFQPRRSTRVSKKPAYLDDYIYLAEVEGERLLLLLNEEHVSYSS